ncbi:protein TIS11-like [Littorina saxatilis]|uniref:C3H1-type domain-containing protein n=1 Tax=Littorina saxatilis TaxID=31220 RepID=A0AAN9BGY5_9CAEN
MSTAVMPSQVDVGESFYQNRRNSSSSACRMQQQQQYDRRHYFAITSAAATTSQPRHRNLSGPSATGTRPVTLDNRALATPPPTAPCSKDTRDSAHRKLDRSLSDSEDRINGNGGRGVNSARYKTELCRPFEESGHCKYGEKCQFAHGYHELRNLSRHPKYKTERCRTYHTIGFCPYGPRCHFIHNEEERNERVQCRKNSSNCNILQQQQQQQQRVSNPSTSGISQRPNNLCGLNSIGSSFESVSTSSSSPGNLSPSLTEDLFPSIGTFSPSSVDAVPSSVDSGSPRSSPVFNFPASDAVGVGSILKPLQVQTAQFYNNVVDMAALHFTMLNISQNQRNNVNNTFNTNLNVTANLSVTNRQQGLEPESVTGVEKVWPAAGVAFPPPSSSPVSSQSDDSMGSTGSLESPAHSPVDNSVHLVNSPLDVGRAMRLPIFNRLSAE